MIAFLPRLFGRMRQSEPNWAEPDELRQRMAGGAALTVLDVRGPDEFSGDLGHIAGAVNIPLGEIPSRLREIKMLGDAPVIVVCRTDKRSAQAAELLRDARFREVRVLRGGMERWNRIGLRTEAGNASPGGAESSKRGAGLQD